MLTLDLRPILKLRSIQNSYTFLRKLGFVPETATKWTNGDVGYMRPEQIEKLCVALNCTPNDLFHYTPDAQKPLAETHALTSLIRPHSAPDITKLLHDLPPEKLNQLTIAINSLKSTSE